MLGGHTARMTADPKWPKGHSILYHVMPRNKTVGCSDSLTHHSGEGVGWGEWAANWWGSTHHSFKTFGLCSQTQYNYPGKIFYHFLSPFLFYKSISIVLTIPTLFFFSRNIFFFFPIMKRNKNIYLKCLEDNMSCKRTNILYAMKINSVLINALLLSLLSCSVH